MSLLREAVEEVLVGLDGDLVDYLLPLIEDGDWEAVAPFILSTGLADDDAGAAALCTVLQLKCTIRSAAKDEDDAPALLKAPVSLKGSESFETSQQAAEQAAFLWGTDKVVFVVRATSNRASPKCRRRSGAREPQHGHGNLGCAVETSGEARRQGHRARSAHFRVGRRGQRRGVGASPFSETHPLVGIRGALYLFLKCETRRFF
jgi:hypothetical protein